MIEYGRSRALTIILAPIFIEIDLALQIIPYKLSSHIRSFEALLYQKKTFQMFYKLYSCPHSLKSIKRLLFLIQTITPIFQPLIFKEMPVFDPGSSTSYVPNRC